ncbi:MAG: tripartite tricarboxylate transporter substrate binding protein [Firmicutes bacterium]|nr:tripartite tricarboxylate transporter substrate binding protein [Bacillota bacterium]
MKRGNRTLRTLWKLGVLFLALSLVLGLGAACKKKEEAKPAPAPAPAAEKKTEAPAPKPEPPKPKYPESGKTFTIVVPYGAGGGLDTAARGLAPLLQKNLGIPVVVENKPGAAGRVAAAALFKQKGDGYTVFHDVLPSRSMGELVYDGDYKTMEFPAVYGYADDTPVIAVAENSPYKTFDDLLTASKNKPLSHGNPGLGTPIHLQSVVLADVTGLALKEVPFETTAKATAAMLGGHIDITVLNTQNLFSFQGLRPIATIGEERHPLTPDLPTLKELGRDVPVIHFTRGYYSPPGIPDDVLKILEKAFADSVADPQWKDFAKKAGYLDIPMSASEFTEVTRKAHEVAAKYAHLFKTAK